MTGQLVFSFFSFFFLLISHEISARRYVFPVTLIAVDDEVNEDMGMVCVGSTAYLIVCSFVPISDFVFSKW